MPRDSQGNCSQDFNWEQDAANGIGIEADRHQQNDDDHLQMLTQSLDRQGRGGMQADLAMGNNKLTQVNEGTVASDAANIGQLQVGAFTVGSTDTGTANNYKVALSPAITAYTEGLIVRFTAANANTGASTLEVNNVVPAPALQWQGKDLVADTITAGMSVVAQYVGSAFQIVNVPEVLPQEYGGTGATSIGTAAFKDVGTAVGDVVELVDVSGNAGWPAVDGSQLTGTINGLTTQNTLDPAADTFKFYDDSASADRKTILQTLIDATLAQVVQNPYVWVRFGSAGGISGQSGVSGVVKNGTGDYTVTFSTAWSSASSYSMGSTGKRQSGDPNSVIIVSVEKNTAPTATTIRVVCNAFDGTPIDPSDVFLVFQGTQ